MRLTYQLHYEPLHSHPLLSKATVPDHAPARVP